MGPNRLERGSELLAPILKVVDSSGIIKAKLGVFQALGFPLGVSGGSLPSSKGSEVWALAF